MGILSTWVVTIAGVVILVNVCEILMPDGEMNKYIKGTLSIICMFVLISPLPELMKTEINISDIIFGENSTVNIDYSFLDYVNRNKADALSKELETKFEKEGFNKVEVGIVPVNNSADFVIDSVVLNLTNLQTESALSKEQIISRLKSLTTEFLNIKSEKVVIYGS